MIKAVRAINAYGDSVLMRLDFPYAEQGPFSLFSIEGLDPGEAEIRATELATMDGAVFNSARQASREITLTVIFNDTYNLYSESTGTFNIQNAREKLYRYFPLKTKIQLGFCLNDPYLSQYSSSPIGCYMCEGYVKSVNADIFSKQCAGRVTIAMLDPKFYFVGNIANITTTTEYRPDNPVYVFTASVTNYDKVLQLMSYSSKATFAYDTTESKWKYVEKSLGGTSVYYSKEELASNGISISMAIYDNQSKAIINVSYFSNSAFSTDLTPAKFYATAQQYQSTMDKFTFDVITHSDTEPIFYDIIIPLGRNISASDLENRGLSIVIGEKYRQVAIDPVAYTVDTVNGNYIQLDLVNLLSYDAFKTRGLVSGDIITISSTPGKRDIGIRLNQSTTDISINGVLSRRSIYRSDWPSVLPTNPMAYAGLFVRSTDSFYTSNYMSIMATISNIVGLPPNVFCVGYKQSKRGL